MGLISRGGAQGRQTVLSSVMVVLPAVMNAAALESTNHMLSKRAAPSSATQTFPRGPSTSMAQAILMALLHTTTRAIRSAGRIGQALTTTLSQTTATHLPRLCCTVFTASVRRNRTLELATWSLCMAIAPLTTTQQGSLS